MQQEFKIGISDYKKSLRQVIIFTIPLFIPLLLLPLIDSFINFLGSYLYWTLHISFTLISAICLIYISFKSFYIGIIKIKNDIIICEKYPKIDINQVQRFYWYRNIKGFGYTILMKNGQKWSVFPYKDIDDEADEEFQKFVNAMEGKYGIKLEKK